MSLQEKFQAAADLIAKLPKVGPLQVSKDERLQFYSLFKQATVGKNENPEPGLLHFVENAKWQAWKKLGDMSKDEAMQKYVDAVKEIIAKMSEKLNITEWLAKANPELPKLFAVINT